MNFRRYILAMVALALFTGFASAQVITGPPTGSPAGTFNCVANVAVPPQLRSEGMTELIGDIVLLCTGGNSLPVGGLVPTANITVSLGTNVTSRLLSSGQGNQSEALLLIDEPNTNLSGSAGPGPTAPVTPCFGVSGAAITGPFGTTTCQQSVAANGQSVTCGSSTTGTTCTGTTSPAMNTFIGQVSGNQVIFNGIPINPPVTGGFARVFRITNIRANVSALGGGGLAGTTQLLASVSISGSTSVPVSNPVLIAGFIQSGLSTSIRNTANSGTAGNQGLNQCGGSSGPTPLSIVRFSENFATAFKVRGGNQTQPGTIYNTESGLTPVGMSSEFGLASYGTRLKATFNNVPAGVRIFVSTSNIVNEFQPFVPQPPAGSSTFSFAQLTASEAGPFSAVGGNTNLTVGTNITPLALAEIPVVNGTATAVWEVLSTNPSAIEGGSTGSSTTTATSNPGTFDFGVWQQFTANPGANSPPVGTATVNLSYAPTPPVAFSAADGGRASSSLGIPRFADTSSANNVFNIRLCNTVLLYPFVTNQAGFDTGLAIANTTTDPFGTRNQNGSCTLNFYGASAPPAVNTGNIATGTVYTTLASTASPGFQGYMIAVCQFQLAHGFAFVSDIGARNLAMGYLALVLPDGTDARNNRTEALNN